MGHAAQDAAARLALACLDLTSLNADDDNRSTAALVARAIATKERWGTGPAALCVWPRFVAQVRAALPASVAVAAVANFPDGGLHTERAVHDARTIIEAGGDEVDLVLPWRALVAGDEDGARRVVRAVRVACSGRRLKLIVESGALPDEATLRSACRIGLDEGVDFLKTSTGKWPVGATLPAARTMLEQIAAHPRGATVGFKAAGGIRRVEDARRYIELVRDILGPAALGPARLRFGASGLLDDIEGRLGGATTTPATGGY